MDVTGSPPWSRSARAKRGFDHYMPGRKKCQPAGEGEGGFNGGGGWVKMAEPESRGDRLGRENMPIAKALILYVLTVPVFFAIDMVWLGLVAKKFYARHLGPLMAPKVLWPAALLFYLLFIAGILIFVVVPAVEKGSWSRALLSGALFGLFTYATYDLTNLATLRDWPILVTVIDLVWGMVLTAAVSGASFWIAGRVL
jgi:uncharacterized membrane protein